MIAAERVARFAEVARQHGALRFGVGGVPRNYTVDAHTKDGRFLAEVDSGYASKAEARARAREWASAVAVEGIVERLPVPRAKGRGVGALFERPRRQSPDAKLRLAIGLLRDLEKTLGPGGRISDVLRVIAT
jgi:hypothetical protein